MPEDKAQVQNTGGETKLSIVFWAMLFLGAAMLDLFQAGISAMTMATLGSLVNFAIDILVGMSLALFFHLKKMLDFKLGLSLILAFAVDFISLGIAPAWLLDITYAWVATDGKNFVAFAPIIGEAARKSALAVMSRGKNAGQKDLLKQRSEKLKERYEKYSTEKMNLPKQKNTENEDGGTGNTNEQSSG